MIANIDNKNALTKCIVYFYDGNCRTFYSLDLKHKNGQRNKALGMRRLDKMLRETFKGQWETAIIYDNKPNGTELAKYKRGIRI